MLQDPPSLKTAMTPFPYAVALDASVDEAERLIAEHDIHHLPIADKHDIVGIVVTNQDLMSVRSGTRRRRDVRVRDVCVKGVYVVDLHEPLQNVVLTMAERHNGSVIVTRQSRLAGVFTWVDACRCFGELLRANAPSTEGDDAA
jgi:predicted transcriptional regulator